MADSRRITLTEPTTDHQIDVRRVPAKCGTYGHTDLEVVCSCSFLHHLSHGQLEDVSHIILEHRLSALEKVVGMNIRIEYDV